MGNDLPFSRIAAILFTDIVGSVQLKESMGAVAYATALAQHDEAFRNLCAKIDGTVVKDTGDGFVATFPTVSAAVTLSASRCFVYDRRIGSGRGCGGHARCS